MLKKQVFVVGDHIWETFKIFEDWDVACTVFVNLSNRFRTKSRFYLDTREFYQHIFEKDQVVPEQSDELFCVKGRFFDSYDDAKDFLGPGEGNVTTHELVRKKK